MEDKRREVKVESHHFYQEGVFHRFAEMGDSLYAIVEDEFGRVHKYDMMSYSLEFVIRYKYGRKK